MQTKVKICGITNIDDAMAAVEAGADALGFIFHPASPRFISIPNAAEISRQAQGHVLRVGVFVDPEPDFVLSALRECALNLLQFHGAEPPEFCGQFGAMAMKAFRVRDEESLCALADYRTDAFLLDSYVAGKPGGTGETFNWSLASEAKKFGRPIFLAGGLHPENVAEAVRAVAPFGVDVSSGVERSPGRKDAARVRAFIQAVRSA